MSRAENGAERAKESDEWSRAVSGSRKKNERSGAQSGRSWNGSGAVSGRLYLHYRVTVKHSQLLYKRVVK